MDSELQDIERELLALSDIPHASVAKCCKALLDVARELPAGSVWTCNVAIHQPGKRLCRISLDSSYGSIAIWGETKSVRFDVPLSREVILELLTRDGKMEVADWKKWAAKHRYRISIIDAYNDRRIVISRARRTR